MTPVSISARLHFSVSSSRALSLPQSSPLNPERLDSFAPSPLAARASAIRSRTCGRQRLAFLAASATGGARKPNPSEGAEAAPPQATELQRRVPQLSPLLAGCPHPSRRRAAPCHLPQGEGSGCRESPAQQSFLVSVHRIISYRKGR